jgi:hypothetical protein
MFDTTLGDPTEKGRITLLFQQVKVLVTNSIRAIISNSAILRTKRRQHAMEAGIFNCT